MKHIRRGLLLAGALAAFVSCAQAQVSPGGVQGVRASGSAGYPPGASYVTGQATGTTAGATVNFPAAANQFSYLCGISVSPGSATAAITISITIANAGAYSWFVGAPVTAAGTTGATFTQPFWPCVRSNLVNQSITISAGALGAGGVNQVVNAWGYTQ